MYGQSTKFKLKLFACVILIYLIYVGLLIYVGYVGLLAFVYIRFLGFPPVDYKTAFKIL